MIVLGFLHVVFLLICGVVVMLVGAFVYYGLMDAKINNTFKQRYRILSAMERYYSEKLHAGEEIKVFAYDLEEFDETLNRFWDWGCKRILPPDKFEIIEPYLKKERAK